MRWQLIALSIGVSLGTMFTCLSPVGASAPLLPQQKTVGAQLVHRPVLGRIDRVVGKDIIATLVGHARTKGLLYRSFHAGDTFQVPSGSRLTVVFYGSYHRYELTGGAFVVGDTGTVAPRRPGSGTVIDRGALDARLVQALPSTRETEMDPEYAAQLVRDLPPRVTPIGALLCPEQESDGIALTFPASSKPGLSLRVFRRAEGNADGTALCTEEIPAGIGSFRLPLHLAADGTPSLAPGEEYDWLLTFHDETGKTRHWTRATFRILTLTESERIRKAAAGILKAAQQEEDPALGDIALLRFYLANDLQESAYALLNRIQAAQAAMDNDGKEVLDAIQRGMAARYAARTGGR